MDYYYSGSVVLACHEFAARANCYCVAEHSQAKSLAFTFFFKLLGMTDSFLHYSNKAQLLSLEVHL